MKDDQYLLQVNVIFLAKVSGFAVSDCPWWRTLFVTACLYSHFLRSTFLRLGSGLF